MEIVPLAAKAVLCWDLSFSTCASHCAAQASVARPGAALSAGSHETRWNSRAKVQDQGSRRQGLQKTDLSVGALFADPRLPVPRMSQLSGTPSGHRCCPHVLWPCDCRSKPTSVTMLAPNHQTLLSVPIPNHRDCKPRSEQWAALGIEPRTSRTLSENHATRPSSQLSHAKN